MSRKVLVPLVLPADPAAAMEAATKQYVDLTPRIATGSGVISISTAGTATSTTVTFPGGFFTATPRVSITATGTTPMTLRGPMANNVTATGMDVWGGRDTGTAGINFNWIAIQ